MSRLDDFLSQNGSSAPAAPVASDKLSTFLSDNSELAQKIETENQGRSWDNPIKESPLGILERARLGWEKTPAAQKLYLQETFGRDNVKLRQNGDTGDFLVRKNGKTYEVDPHFEWTFNSKGAAAGMAGGAVLAGGPGALAGAVVGGLKDSIANKSNLKDFAGDVAQFAGQYGLKAAGAAAAVSTGPVGLTATLLAGAAGAGVAELGDITGRKLAGGREESLPQNQEELGKQLQAAMIFGATQEVGGKVINWAGSKIVGALSKSIEAMGVTPLGKTMSAKILSTISGRPESEARVIVEDPKGMIPWNVKAREDSLNNTDKVWGSMRQMVEEAHQTFRQAKGQVIGKQYDAVDEVAKKISYAPQQEVTNAMDALYQNGFSKAGKAVNAEASKDVERSLNPADKSAINYVIGQGRKLVEKGEDVSYKDMRNMIGGLDNLLSGESGISDNFLRQTLREYRAGLKQHLVNRLHEKDPATAQVYTELHKQYGPTMHMMEELASKGGSKIDTFLKQIVKEDGTFNSELLTSLSKTLGTKDPTDNILRAYVARNFAKAGLWGGKRIMGVPVGSPSGAMGLAQGVSAVKGDVNEVVQAIPYMGKTLDFLKQVGDKNRSMLLQNENGLRLIGESMSSAISGEQQAKQQLLQKAQQETQ